MCDGKENGALFRYSDERPMYYVQCTAGNAVCRSCPENEQFNDKFMVCLRKTVPVDRNGQIIPPGDKDDGNTDSSNGGNVSNGGKDGDDEDGMKKNEGGGNNEMNENNTMMGNGMNCKIIFVIRCL